jgi:hypothetical protein
MAKKSKRERLDDHQPVTAPAERLPRVAPMTPYDPKTYPAQAKFLATRGATLADIGECFGVSTRTITRWRILYPEFAEALRVGNEVFDSGVERALAERAMGYMMSWDEEMLHPITGEKAWVFKRQYLPPDVKAINMWLTNRKPNDWQHLRKHQVEVKRKTSEILVELRTDLLELKAQGYLDSITIPALPAPKESADE